LVARRTRANRFSTIGRQSSTVTRAISTHLSATDVREPGR
jgi:hypothetical protein